MLTEELQAMSAPRRIIEAASEVQKYLDAKLRPPASLVGIIEQWVYRPQNRYGR